MKLTPRAKLVLLMSLFALPIAASFLTYHFGQPSSTANYGELLLPPRTLPAGTFERAAGGGYRFSELSGKWALLMADSGACAERCVEKLTAMRQVRLAAGREAGRVSRVFVADDGRAPDAAVLAPFEGTAVVLARDGVAGLDRDHVYLADPHGNVMMRWPAHADRKRMYKDLSRLLKASQIG